MKTNFITYSCKFLSLFFRQGALPPNPHSILILKPCCLGDVILATPAIRALKQGYPQAAIDFMVGQWSRPALENHPDLRHLIDAKGVGQGRVDPSALWHLIQALRQQKYDLAVTLDRSPLIGLIPYLVGIRHRLGLDSFGRGFAHTWRVPVPAQPRHEALIYLDGVTAAGLTVTQDGQPKFWPNFHPRQADKANLPPIDKRPFVIIHPGGGVNPGLTMISKRWPLDRLAALADHLAGQGLHIVLTGSREDIPLCQTLAAATRQTTPQILSGQLSLGQFGALCQQAALFVGGDTGAMHLAVAVGCKTVAIFGPSDPKRYAPFAPPNQAVTLWRSVALPQGGVGQGQPTFSWDQGVDVEEVWAACQKLLGS